MKSIKFKLAASLLLSLLILQYAFAASRANDAEMARRASMELKAVLMMDIMSESQIRDLILQEKFVEFENQSNKYEAEFLKSSRYEYPLVKLYAALDVDNDLLRQKLDKWVLTRPSYISRGARGIYKRFLGYRVRGSNYSSETPDANMRKMSEIYAEAKNDLLFAIKTDKRFSPAYRQLMEIEMSEGGMNGCKEVLDTAIASIPETYYVRHDYLACLRPRWGGSYREMKEYGESIDAAAQLNARIWSLKAELPAERGYSALLDNDYDRAIHYYSQALMFGDRLEFLENRGRMYVKTKQYELARADFLKYQEYDRKNDSVNQFVAFLNSKINTDNIEKK